MHIDCMINKYWNAENAEQWLELVKRDMERWKKVPSDNKRADYYANIPASFDIETSSFYEGEKKRAVMYSWQLGVNGFNIIGRTWDQFGAVMVRLHELLEEIDCSLLIYVHNLSYEFQWMRKYFTWDKVFSLKVRQPVYACAGYFEFRCSYLLTSMGLQKCGENLQKYTMFKKLMGNLDYSLLRHSMTPLTVAEKEYCLGDINVVQALIQEKIEAEGGINKLPLTNTGYVRQYCRKCCLPEVSEKKRLEYHALMKSLQINNETEYEMLQRAFQGGFTHASVFWSGKTITSKKSTFKTEFYFEDGIDSLDICSSYPYVMCCCYFPMSRWEDVEIENDKQLDWYLKRYCCLFDIEIENLKPKKLWETPLSGNNERCAFKNGQLNNGRLVKCDVCRTTITELDYETLKSFYTWDNIRVLHFKISMRGYLPKDLVESVLKFYKDKTILKNVLGKEAEYMLSKNMVNSVFGMMVTNIVRKEVIYDCDEESWLANNPDVAKELKSYNNSFTRFLSYSWGVWVTAHARRRLFKAIEAIGEDYIYSDTDSVKLVNYQKHEKWFEEENKRVDEAIKKVCDFYEFDVADFSPKDIEGVEHKLGTWDKEHGYHTFKCLGAKRYMFVSRKDNKLSLTVSGLNKKIAVPWLLEKYNGNEEVIFEIFGEGFYVPKGHTGKLTHTYIDEYTQGELVDYQGTPYHYCEMSSIHMEPQGYYMSIPYEYMSFLSGIQEDLK